MRCNMRIPQHHMIWETGARGRGTFISSVELDLEYCDETHEVRSSFLPISFYH